MIIIKHRVNTINKIIKTPKSYGVEIDLRSSLKTIYLNHDPFKNGENLEKFLNNYNHNTLIVNVKSEFAIAPVELDS